jgi:hypothetical protein
MNACACPWMVRGRLCSAANDQTNPEPPHATSALLTRGQPPARSCCSMWWSAAPTAPRSTGRQRPETTCCPSGSRDSTRGCLPTRPSHLNAGPSATAGITRSCVCVAVCRLSFRVDCSIALSLSVSAAWGCVAFPGTVLQIAGGRVALLKMQVVQASSTVAAWQGQPTA